MTHIPLTVLDLGGTFVFAISGAVATTIVGGTGVFRAAVHGDPAWLALSPCAGP